MVFILKLLVSAGVILGASSLGKKFPYAAALLAVAPLTSLLVIFWLRFENPSELSVVANYVRGATLGILPTVVFFIVLSFCLSQNLTFPSALTVALGVWALGALAHQYYFH
jgi:hypothetical protein